MRTAMPSDAFVACGETVIAAERIHTVMKSARAHELWNIRGKFRRMLALGGPCASQNAIRLRKFGV